MDKKVNFIKLDASIKTLLNLLICLSILCGNNCYATDNKDKDNQWVCSIVPFLWAVSVTGDIEVGVPAEGIENQLLHISENFLGIMSHVHSGGMLDVTLAKKNFGLFLSGMYVNLKGLNVTTSDGFEVEVSSKYGLLSAGAYYLIYEYNLNQYRRFRIGPYAGLRYTWNDSSAFLIEAPEYNSGYDADWTEPIIGATVIFDINQFWIINMAADIGVFKNNQDSYNIVALLGYKPSKHLTVYLGYRELYQSLIEGSGADFFEWKMHTGGPILGVAFVF